MGGDNAGRGGREKKRETEGERKKEEKRRRKKEKKNGKGQGWDAKDWEGITSSRGEEREREAKSGGMMIKQRLRDRG